jgi:four helix bundle protein
MDPHEKPDAWQAAHQLALEVYAATERWPRAERFELTTQVRRAALSVPTNIAEAWHVWGRASCGVSSMSPGGSLAELSYLLQFARDRGVLEPQEWAKLHGLRTQVGRLTRGLLRGMSDPP